MSMTPAELKHAQKTLGLDQVEFAAALGLKNPGQVSRMQNGSTITAQTALIVRALLAFGLPDTWPESGRRE